MKILFAASEVSPFAKTGGLADVSSALPKAVKELGHDIRVILPLYSSVDRKAFDVHPTPFSFDVKAGEGVEKCAVFESVLPGSDVIAYFISSATYFDRDGLYGSGGADYDDNAERFSFFCRAALEFLKIKGWQPDILHLNDWQTALIAAYIDLKREPSFAKSATVYSIHNMAYQGQFPEEKFAATGLDKAFMDDIIMKERQSMVFAKAGISLADIITTVSETYSREILTGEQGCGLEGLLGKRKGALFGVQNGIDVSVWNPAADALIPRKFNVGTLSMRGANKAELQARMKLKKGESIPLLGIVSRLADQKGFDILIDSVDGMAALGCQLVVLGVGDEAIAEALKQKQRQHPNSVAVSITFDEKLAHLIYAGSDMFLMPSRYEPCGLGQLISFKYGSVPVVRRTGGLADTVTDVGSSSSAGTGFVFDEYSSAALLEKVRVAVEIFKRDRRFWLELQKRIMSLDHSWKQAAKKYVALYVRALNEKRG